MSAADEERQTTHYLGDQCQPDGHRSDDGVKLQWVTRPDGTVLRRNAWELAREAVTAREVADLEAVDREETAAILVASLQRALDEHDRPCDPADGHFHDSYECDAKDHAPALFVRQVRAILLGIRHPEPEAQPEEDS